jgi:hypothetical protein
LKKEKQVDGSWTANMQNTRLPIYWKKLELEDQIEIKCDEPYGKPDDPSDNANELEMFFDQPLLEE